MAQILISLGGGFDGNRVVIALDGQTVFSQEGVTSSPLTDLAKELQPISVPAAQSKVSARVLDKEGTPIAAASIVVQSSRDCYVAVYLEKGPSGDSDIRFAVSDTPLGFG